MNGIPMVIKSGGRGLKTPVRSIVVFLVVLISGGNAMAGDSGLMEAPILNGELQKWAVLDARPKSEWLAGHIPGAISFSWENFTRVDEKGVQSRTFTPQELAAALGSMGVDEKTPVVIYGDAEKSWGGEGWDFWALSWIGHKGPLRVLAGGIQSWRGHKYPVTTDEQKGARPRAVYKFALNPQIRVSTEEIEQKKSSFSLVDTRSTMEWLGGSIPGAVHIQWTEFYNGDDRRPIDAATLKKLLKDNGVDTNKPVVYYCKSGVRSGYAWMVHQLDGLPDAKNYEGGMEAWRKSSAK
jgi:thiosulfate/3-mercaptopyruvate sulfurtransferase